jgi:hypothetical protein
MMYLRGPIPREFGQAKKLFGCKIPPVSVLPARKFVWGKHVSGFILPEYYGVGKPLKTEIFKGFL